MHPPQPNSPKSPKKINIELTEEVADGIYSNLALISHTNAEFIVDFIRLLPGIPKAKVKSRIILNPLHAKRLLRALAENIAKYESLHGTVPENTGGQSNYPPFNVGGPPTQA